MKYKKSKIVIIGIFFFAFLLATYPRLYGISYNPPEVSGTYVPEGLIALWSGSLDSIPDGWVLCDGNDFTPNMSDRFIYNTDGTEDAGETGGGVSHSHLYTEVPLHDHGVTGEAQCTHSHTYHHPSGTVDVNSGSIYPTIDGSRSTGGATASHTHTTTVTGLPVCETSTSENILPTYFKLAFIKKINTNPVIPAGIILIWAGLEQDIPEGWSLCNGTNNTPDLRGRFIMGETLYDPGESGGNATHSHTYTDIPEHSHTTASAGHSHGHDARCDSYLAAGLGLISVTAGICELDHTGDTSVPHSHTMNAVGQEICETEEVSHLPPFITVGFIMNTQIGTGIPTGCISFWGENLADIPVGWDQCDGTGDTVDLREKFLKGASFLEPIGFLGGALTHTHVYTEIPLHNHVINEASMTHDHSLYEIYKGELVAIGSHSVYSDNTGTAYTSTRDAEHSHDILPAGIATPHTEPESNLPPYVKLTFIQHTAEVTNLEWVTPEEDTVILFPRAAEVRFDFEYSWAGLGNEITLSLTNDTDDYDAGSVMGLDHVFIPYLEGDVDATFHLLHDTTELTYATRSFIFTNNRDPTVTLVGPNGGETISGTYEITWTGADADGDQIYYTLEYNIDNSGWVEIASGLTGTSYNWDTTGTIDSDSVIVRVIAEDAFGGQNIDESNAVFTIDNEPGNGGNGTNIPGYNSIFLITIILLTSLMVFWRSKKLTR